MIFNSVLTFEERKLVEGYIAEKYRCNEFLGGLTSGSGSFIHPYRMTPTIISSTVNLNKPYSQGLVAWFDAADIYKMWSQAIGGVVTVIQWIGYGSIGSIVLESDVARRPTLIYNAQNGLPGVRFTVSGGNGTPIGTDASYQEPITRFSTLSENNEYTIISVYKQTAYLAGRMISNIHSTETGNPRLSTFTDKFSYYKTAGSEQTNTYSPASVGSTTYLVVNYRRGNAMYTRRNGINVGITTVADLNITGNQFGITLGAYSLTSFSTNPFDGEIYEHIIFRYALKDQAIFQLEGYLAWKWGLNGSLPATHPYYKVMP
jgi:hypothetical protein